MAKMTQELHDKAHEQVAREQQAAERRLAEIRAHTEEQLRSEREVSDSVRHAGGAEIWASSGRCRPFSACSASFSARFRGS